MPRRMEKKKQGRKKDKGRKMGEKRKRGGKVKKRKIRANKRTWDEGRRRGRK